MKNKPFYPLLLFVAVIVLISSLFLPTACGKSPISTSTSPGWDYLYRDKGWVDNLNQYLSLSYVEENDRAVFTVLSPRNLMPSLYTTYNIIRFLKATGMHIENKEQIINYVYSLKNQNGAYLDSFNSINPPGETRRAITILTDLGVVPDEIDSTVSYLLSLQYDDGTFLIDAQKGISPMEDTRLKRLDNGTYSVIKTLVMLGPSDKIPQETKDVIADEVALMLGENGPFPSLIESHNMGIIVALELLVDIDPGFVPERGRDFVVFALEEIVNLPPDVFQFPSAMNSLLNIAMSCGIPVDNETLDRVRVFLKENIFPQQNQNGGFGPSGTIEPLTTVENVILADRLGMEYPNLDRLLSEIDKHWVGNGWVAFTVPSINASNYISTYYAIEIANFSGYSYDKTKTERFLTTALSGSLENSAGSIGFVELYYAIKAIKAMNGELSGEQIQKAKELCEILLSQYLDASGDNIDSRFAYASLISKEIGFEFSPEFRSKISDFAEIYKENMLSGKVTMTPLNLYLVWNSLDGDNTILSREEIMDFLRSIYDPGTGALSVKMVSNMPVNPEQMKGWVPEWTPQPEISTTYQSAELIRDIGEELPDKAKTYDFVMACKQKYGFSRSSELAIETNLEATFSALMLLKEFLHN